VEIIPGEAERDSGTGLKVFGFIAESVFAFIPESCSRSPGTPFGIVPESRSPCPGFPSRRSSAINVDPLPVLLTRRMQYAPKHTSPDFSRRV
jgi:hypothetical protein